MKKYQIKTSSANIITDISSKELETELLFGEIFIGEEESDGWVHGYCEHDDYKGWVRRDNLSTNILTPTHIINVAHTITYKESNIKSEAIRHLAFASQVNVTETNQDMALLSTGEWISAKHISPIGTKEEDITKTALKFLNTPYHWGGRSGYNGLDCSGLVQVCLAFAGIKSPRDSGPQSESLGTEIDSAQKGDLVFFKGHVAMMIDNENVIHATAHSMQVSIEPLKEVEKRAAIKVIKRL